MKNSSILLGIPLLLLAGGVVLVLWVSNSTEKVARQEYQKWHADCIEQFNEEQCHIIVHGVQR